MILTLKPPHDLYVVRRSKLVTTPSITSCTTVSLEAVGPAHLMEDTQFNQATPAGVEMSAICGVRDDDWIVLYEPGGNRNVALKTPDDSTTGAIFLSEVEEITGVHPCGSCVRAVTGRPRWKRYR